MRTTIDKAGRVVIPVEARRQARLQPGTELEVRVDYEGVHLVPCVPEPDLVEEDGWLRVRASTTAPRVDVAELIREERDRWPLK
ncbi:MAG TPA: AbrB/MazE/SpoVT family DNA-binding domain-containing protein [Myxococcota bacterium]|nr:AbrB/MazE/SpoVT family DNA-binding domain-containing protein [Myxococcota bacterium]